MMLIEIKREQPSIYNRLDIKGFVALLIENNVTTQRKYRSIYIPGSNIQDVKINLIDTA